MKLTRIPLAKRLDATAHGRTCQPEYIPCLIQGWADMPLKAYFGGQTEALRRLYKILGISEDANPPYRLAAGLVFEQMHSFAGMDEEALRLLTAPVKAYIGAGEEGKEAAAQTRPAMKRPIADRLRDARRGEDQIPAAMGLCTVDFLETVGEMTGQKDRYQSIYSCQIAPYEIDESPRILQLIVNAESFFEDTARQNLLYWVLIEPFLTLNTSFYRKETIQ